jgi:hypothetical protein
LHWTTQLSVHAWWHWSAHASDARFGHEFRCFGGVDAGE